MRERDKKKTKEQCHALVSAPHCWAVFGAYQSLEGREKNQMKGKERGEVETTGKRGQGTHSRLAQPVLSGLSVFEEKVFELRT